MKQLFILISVAICLNTNAQVCFNAPTNFATGIMPRSVSTADFNGDGKADLAVANYLSNDISVLLCTGNGNFGAAVNFSAGTNPFSVTSADFNGDGKMDLAVANDGSNNVSVLLGTGTGSFGAAANFSTGGLPRSVISADFNMDGYADLAVANSSSNNVSVLLGTGTGSFSAATNFSAGVEPTLVNSADFNGDGKIDLAVGNYTSQNVSILLGTGTGSFGAAVNFTVGYSPIAITSADFNRDGKIDLAVTGDANNVAVLLGNGTGSFGAPANFGVGNTPQSITSADFNGDGKTDLATANLSSGGSLSVLLGTGTGGFSIAVDFVIGPMVYVITADFDRDGKADLAAANYYSNNVSVLLNCTTFCSGNFGSVSNFTVGTNPYSVTSEDFNRDGIIDLALANYGSNNISVLLGSGSGSFGTAANYATGSGPYSITSADFNGDGKPDLAVANNGSNNVSVLLGSGTGSFGASTNFTVGTDPRSVKSADFNGDGKADLVAVNKNTSDVSVLLGTGTGSFSAATSFAAGSEPVSITCADFNGDGKVDLATGGLLGGANNLSVLLGTGTGSFGTASSFEAGPNPFMIANTDFNKDGKIDLAVANAGTSSISVLLGIGDGSFIPPVTFPAGTDPYSITIADFNWDGKTDLAVANYNSNNVSVLFGTGTASFGAPTNFATGTSPASVIGADFNRDGKTDLAVANYTSNNISILLFNTPEAPTGIALQSFCSGYSPVVGDLAATGTAIQWYAASTGGSALAPGAALVNNTHYYASQTISSCGGESTARFDVTATINTSPGAPTGTPSQSFCSGALPTVASLVATGTGIQWYAAASGGSALTTTTALSTSHYYASQTVGGCESTSRFDVNATVNTTPGAPTGTASQSFCSATSPTIVNLAATGTAIQWYAASAGGSALTTTLALVSGTHYFATQTVSGCESTTRFDVTATVNITPGVPTGTALQSFCSGASPTVANLAATGTSVQWYALSSGGSALASTTALVTATDYYASQTISGCESSLRFGVTATINATPSAPTGTAAQTFCSGTSPTVADLVATGTSIQWYALSSGGSALASTTALVTATDYYASQTVSGCESTTRFGVTATVNTIPGAPTGTAAQLFCTGTSPTVADLVATGTSVQWYALSSGGSVLASTTALLTATDYFATETVNGCESTTRFGVTATINATPGAPTGTAAQAFCSGTSPIVADLIATGTSVQWYALSSGGSVLASTTALITATDYFATETVNGCESTTRFGVTATINATPVAPTGTAAQTFCSGTSPTVADLIATATSIQWYALSSGGSALATTTALVTATDYFATETVNGCESTTRFGVTATVNVTPGVPTGTASQSFCVGTSPTIADLVATGTSIQWYASSIGGSPLATTTALVTATYYFATETINGCESTARFDVLATVDLMPDVTALLNGVTLTANQNGASYQWLNCDNANAPLFGQFNQSFTATANGNYAVSITKNSCTDTSLCYNVNNVGIIENTSAETITIYPNPFTSKTTIAFTQEQSNCTIKITDVLGKEIKTLNFIGRELIIEREEMPAGIYFVQIVDRNKNVINRKIVIE